MKKTLALFALTSLLRFTAFSQGIPCGDHDKIAEKLRLIREVDQNSRALFIKQMGENDPQKTRELALKMRATDKENQQYVAALLDSCGWPKGLSADDNHTLFLVIDHADAGYMNKYFPLLKLQADSGVIAKSDLATLQDRMMLKSGQKQQYGTQTFKIGAVVYVWPVADVEGLAERRQLMGLPPMDEYLETVKKRYSAEVLWDKALTVEDAQQKMQKKS